MQNIGGQTWCIKGDVKMANRVFSLTWSAGMQIDFNNGKVLLKKKV